jgi:integrase
MAALQERNGSFRVIFRFQGKQRSFTLGEVSRQEAEGKAGQVDLLLLRLKQNLIELPPGISIEEFLFHDGKVRKPEEARPLQVITFATFKDKYLETHGSGAMEQNSLATVTMHLKHFQVTLGPAFPLQQLQMADLQRHINRRLKKLYRGKPLSPATLKKEMSSLRAAWNWAANMSLVTGTFPAHGLVYPKHDEKMPYMTRHEIERRLSPKMTEDARAALWECLYLTQTELTEFLEFVKDNAAHGWIHPAVAFAAHTGARRSEILRVKIHDLDFESKTVLIHERKRSRKKRTTRRVPLTPYLITVLQEWLANHPGGTFLFCNTEIVPRSKKRSQTTGHQWKDRPKSHKGRLATVKKREVVEVGQLTRDETHDHFRRTLAGSKWDVLRGLHTLRHGFISACASNGVDQRLIDEWVGHQTEEQRKRYRHLYPSTQQEAIGRVFGTSANP